MCQPFTAVFPSVKSLHVAFPRVINSMEDDVKNANERHCREHRDLLRMGEWLLVALVLYGTALILMRLGDTGPVQTLIWKLGHVTLGGYAGYWIDRKAFRDRIRWDTTPLVMIRRAIIIFGSMYTLGTGL